MSADVVIVGTGCAGLTAAIYTARANLEPLILEGEPSSTSDQPGGQLMLEGVLYERCANATTCRPAVPAGEAFAEELRARARRPAHRSAGAACPASAGRRRTG